MLKIGLTGGIGSGKSVVARIFKILEVPVYHADSEAKRIMNTHSDVRNEIRKLLGDQAYREGKLDKAYVAAKVFTDIELLNELNEIVHPSVRKDFLTWSEKFRHFPYIIEEAAILFETGFYKDFDYMLVVYASEELRIRRVMARDRAGRAEILKRMSNQMSQERKMELADFTVFNNENDLIIPQVLSLHHKFLSLQK
jgi:dephospho-CoA kinase